MKLLTLSAFVFLLSILTKSEAQSVIPFSDKRWKIQSAGQLVEYYKGYECLYLKGGSATLSDVKFLNGIIEFDICLTEQISFSGLFFRQTSPGNHEEIYLRPHQSGNPDAFQYTPVFNGNAAWQLYHDQYEPLNDGFIHWKSRGIRRGFNDAIDFPMDRWMHVKLLVKNDKAELYIDNKPNPVAFIYELLHHQLAGAVGLTSSVSAMRFANFSCVNTDNVVFRTEETISIVTPPHTITEWQFSTAFAEASIKKLNVLENSFLSKFTWKKHPVERTGLINLSRFASITDSSNTIFAKLTVFSDKDQLKKMDIGYSDRIKVYCNGQALYSGNNYFRTRDYRYLGTIGYFESVYLPLKKGENTVLLAISENFGGWGLMGKWEDEAGISE